MCRVRLGWGGEYMSTPRGLRWCRTCRHWTRHRRLGRCSVCVPCAARFGDAPDREAGHVPTEAHDARRPLPQFDGRELAAGAAAEDRQG